MCPPFVSLLVSALFRWPCSISIHLSPRSVTAGVPTLYAGHVALLFISCRSVTVRWPCSISIPLISGLHVLYMCLPALGCCVRLWLAILCTCLPALGCCVCLCLAILNFTCVSHLTAVCNPLHLSPSSRLLYIPSSPAISTSSLRSFVSQFWMSQTLVAECSV